ncbi:nucleoside transporter [Oesophagostomum dentatum]|uniref:Nucleoside transporter n=1 Tax=Oesophagostomum dentatum TaxID=61180 RepID=A0A0B1TUG9_OESDE|nr:nucleoside transporter [Oesophagostomum dentatum]
MASCSETFEVQDVGNLVYLIIMLHGVGTLMPWNMFITIAPDYYTNYKMKTFDENGTAHATEYSANFLNYLAIASQIPNLLLNFINIFVTVKGDLTKRISLSLLIVGSMIIFTMSFVYVDTWSWMGTFFVITLISIVILNGANGIYQNSIFGLASDFPFKFTNAVIIGNNLCGTFVTVVNIITTLVSRNTANAAFAYFGISLFTLALCFTSFFLLKKQVIFFMHNFLSSNWINAMCYRGFTSTTQNEQCKLELPKMHRKIADRPPVTTWMRSNRQGWPQMINVYLVFFVSLCIFPGIMVDVRDELVGQHYSFILPERFFVPITCFLLFNVFAFIGSMLASRYQYPGPDKLWMAVYPRLLFIPFFAFCNFRPLTRKWPVLFPNTWLYVFMGIIMSISSGYLSGLGMMYTPRVVEASKSRIASMMAGFFLIFGIVSGLAFTIAVSAFIEH